MHSFRSTLDFDSKLEPQIMHNWNFRRPHTCYAEDEFAEWNDKSLQLEFSKQFMNAQSFLI